MLGEQDTNSATIKVVNDLRKMWHCQLCGVGDFVPCILLVWVGWLAASSMMGGAGISPCRKAANARVLRNSDAINLMLVVTVPPGEGVVLCK